MKMNKVRCWEYPTHQGVTVFASYPEDNSGYDLVMCFSCGQVYSISITQEVYGEKNRDAFTEHANCIHCHSSLKKNIGSYPENFITDDKTICNWERPREYPIFESVIMEYPDLFEIEK